MTPRRWREIWLNEGFATWAEWYGTQHEGGPNLRQVFRRLYATPAERHRLLEPAPGDPGRPANLFDGTIYDRGGMTLEALREKVGGATFFRILRDWVTQHRYGNASTRSSSTWPRRDSGVDLGHFLHAWLFGEPAAFSAASRRSTCLTAYR